MRMWMVPPNLMCRQHLLGEHRELHALAAVLAGRCQKRSLAGHIERGQLELEALASRHEELHQEMTRRWGTLYSPLPVFVARFAGHVDRAGSLVELRRRCQECRRLA